MKRASRHALPVLIGAAVLLALPGCGTDPAGTRAPAGKLDVVAAENFWGSIAAQLGGTKVAVKSIIVNPDTDPHAYEPTAADAVRMARARLAIVTGIGYDRWATQLLAADTGSSASVLNVGDLLGLGEGDNPHQWYSPASVRRVVGQLVVNYSRLDPRDSAYFARRGAAFETGALAEYHRLIAEIRRRYRGVRVGYSESVFEPLGRALGLHLATPESFAKAIAEGTEVTAADKLTVDRQAQRRRIKVWIYNAQNAAPDVQRVNQIARAADIPIAAVTETLSPASASFQQWQVSELNGLLLALERATGR